MNIPINKDFHLSRIHNDDKDRTSLVFCMKDKDIYAGTLTVPYPYLRSHAGDFITSTQHSAYDAVIRNTETQELMGSIGIKVDRVQPHKAILGYWLAKEYRGKGLMTATVTVFTDFCFKNFKLHRLSASCFESNPASARVLEKSGFKLEGLMIDHYKKDGKFHNGKLYGRVLNEK